MLLDYFLIPLLSIIYVALTAGRLMPHVPYIFWTVLFTVSLTLMNIPGIRVTTRASAAMMAIMTACAVLFRNSRRAVHHHIAWLRGSLRH